MVSLFRPGTPASAATLQASAALLAALVRAVVLDYGHAAIHTAQVAAALHRALLVTPPTDDVHDAGNVRLLAQQRAVLIPDPAHTLAALP